MSKALVVGPAPALQTVFTNVPGVTPQTIIDGVGAIVEVPDALVAAVRGILGVAAVATGPIANLALVPAQFQPWLQAWNKRFDPTYVNMLATRPPRWFTSPVPCVGAVSLVAPPVQTMTLTGDIAVGIITVDGPAGSTAKLSPSDLLDLTLAVSHGFDILYSNAPSAAKLVFMVEPRLVAINVDPATIPGAVADPATATAADYESRESKWRDPALAALGLPAGFDGINKYRSNLVARAWPTGTPQKSIVMLLTNFPTAHFAYAAGGRVTMHLATARASANVGPNNLDRVIAHETCHLFNAPDEYGGCSPLQTFGPFNVVNGNCNNPLGSPCLMNGQSDTMCVFTKAHVGWSPI
jgi:hypothetical protein